MLAVSEYRVLREVFEAKGGEVTGDWRKLHTAELGDLYQRLLVASHEEGPNGQGMWHVC